MYEVISFSKKWSKSAKLAGDLVATQWP